MFQWNKEDGPNCFWGGKCISELTLNLPLDIHPFENAHDHHLEAGISTHQGQKLSCLYGLTPGPKSLLTHLCAAGSLLPCIRAQSCSAIAWIWLCQKPFDSQQASLHSPIRPSHRWLVQRDQCQHYNLGLYTLVCRLSSTSHSSFWTAVGCKRKMRRENPRLIPFVIFNKKCTRIFQCPVQSIRDRTNFFSCSWLWNNWWHVPMGNAHSQRKLGEVKTYPVFGTNMVSRFSFNPSANCNKKGKCYIGSLSKTRWSAIFLSDVIVSTQCLPLPPPLQL